MSVPPCAAAASLKIPVFTHESDYSPGLATRINGRFAQKVFIPYRESAIFFPGRAAGKICVSGNPIRPEFADADPAKGRAFLTIGDDERILLVLGGSQGSREINELVWACLPELTRRYTVIHQTGDDSAQSTGTGHYRPFAYFHEELPHILAAAELVICRSGAGTIWECASLRKPMVLIPLRGSGTRGDQVENARIFREAGAAICFTPEADRAVSAGKFSALVTSLADDPGKRQDMSSSDITGAADCKVSGAAAFIAEEIHAEIIRKTGREHE